MVAINISHSRPRPAVAAAARPSRVVPQSVRGYYRNVKWLLLIGMLAVYYITPFLRWQRGPGEPSQAVLLDFANGRLYAFFIELWPQDLYFVTGLLVLAVFVLIFTNAVGGRLWCGFACPQTVWTDLFLLVERWIEGDRRLLPDAREGAGKIELAQRAGERRADLGFHLFKDRLVRMPHVDGEGRLARHHIARIGSRFD